MIFRDSKVNIWIKLFSLVFFWNRDLNRRYFLSNNLNLSGLFSIDIIANITEFGFLL
jgi:hypothetical protein